MRIVVVGCGFVGEHCLSVFNRLDEEVIGVDKSADRRSHLKAMYPTVDFYAHVADVPPPSSKDVVFIVAVPTPLQNETDADAGPDLSIVRTALAEVSAAMRGGVDSVVLESSVTPGFTSSIFAELQLSGGFSPERVDPGRTLPRPWEIPKVFACVGDDGGRALSLYERAYEELVHASSPEQAECCKLMENCYRLVNIAYANQCRDYCEEIGVDHDEVVKLMMTKPYGFSAFWSGLGAGGTCIPVNPAFLLSRADIPLLRLARDYNFDLPEARASLFGETEWECSSIGFKPGQNNLVLSPPLRYARALKHRGVRVKINDPTLTEGQKAGLREEDFHVI